MEKALKLYSSHKYRNISDVPVLTLRVVGMPAVSFIFGSYAGGDETLEEPFVVLKYIE